MAWEGLGGPKTGGEGRRDDPCIPMAVEAEDKKAAFREIMKKQVSRVALTIKHTDVNKEELRDLFARGASSRKTR